MRNIVAAIVLSASTAAFAMEPPSEATKAANAAVYEALNFDDREDFKLADKGFIAGPHVDVIRNDKGIILRDFREDSAFKGKAPDTVNPSLWRNATLVTKSGLFEVMPGIWQVRGYDLAIMTLIRGKDGLIVVDPLTVTETAKSAMELARKHIGDLPITAVIYTHSHMDHFGGVRGIVDEADVKAGKVQIFAPDGFTEEAISENVIAGNAMSRRAAAMFATGVNRSPGEMVSAGLGPIVAQGTYSLIPPTHVVETDEHVTIDGVKFEFQLTPNAEAPAEMHFYLPEKRALCLAENANGAMHNVLTPRGAVVRDTRLWASYLTEALQRFGDKTDLVFTSHFWPRWGNEAARTYIARHRDAYKYLHDQSVRMMNLGLNGNEIAERIKLPPVLARSWFNRPHYGSLKFNARAVYQRYMGHFNGNAAWLDPLPDPDRGARYVAALGGADAVLEKAEAAREKGEERWAAELLTHLVMSEPGNARARSMLAGAFDQLAYRAETAPWRNFYQSAALELRGKPFMTDAAGSTDDISSRLPLADILDLMAVRLDPARAGDRRYSVAFNLADSGEARIATVENSVLVHRKLSEGDQPQVKLTMPRMLFLGMISGAVSAEDAAKTGALQVEGDPAVIQAFVGLFETPPQRFPLALP